MKSRLSAVSIALLMTFLSGCTPSSEKGDNGLLIVRSDETTDKRGLPDVGGQGFFEVRENCVFMIVGGETFLPVFAKDVKTQGATAEQLLTMPDGKIIETNKEYYGTVVAVPEKTSLDLSETKNYELCQSVEPEAEVVLVQGMRPAS